MGSSILRGITTALLVTVLTLFAGIVWGIMDLGGLSISLLLDIGLLASCLVGGYRVSKESGNWLLGGVVGAGYVTVGTLLLALFLPIRGWGFIQVLMEGAIIGLVAGAVGVGGVIGGVIGTGRSGAWSEKRSQFTPAYAGYEANEDVGSKFDWEKEGEPQEWKKVPVANWLESSESDFLGNRGAKKGCDKNSEVQWPWDKEEEEQLIASGSSVSEPLVVWEPDRPNNNAMGWNRTNIEGKKPCKESRPWWEQ